MNPITDTQRPTNAHTLKENAIPAHVTAAIIQAFTEIEQILYTGRMSDDAKDSLSVCNAAFWGWIDEQLNG